MSNINTTSNKISDWPYKSSDNTVYIPSVFNTPVRPISGKEDDHQEVRLESKSKFVPISVLSKESLYNHFAIRSGDIDYMIQNDKIVKKIINFLENEVEDLYSYVESEFFGESRIDLYFESKDDFDMLVQYVMQWKLESTDDEEEEEDDEDTMPTSMTTNINKYYKEIMELAQSQRKNRPNMSNPKIYYKSLNEYEKYIEKTERYFNELHQPMSVSPASGSGETSVDTSIVKDVYNAKSFSIGVSGTASSTSGTGINNGSS